MNLTTTAQTLASNLPLFNSTRTNHTLHDGTVATQTDKKLSLRSLAYILIGSFGCCANVLCLIVFLASRRLRSKGVHVFLLNQTVADLYCCIVLVATYDDMVSVNNYIPFHHDETGQTNDCSSVWVMQQNAVWSKKLDMPGRCSPRACQSAALMVVLDQTSRKPPTLIYKYTL